MDAELEKFLVELRSKLETIEERLKPRPSCFKYPQAAEEIGIGLTKLKRMVRRGQIRVSTVGGVPMISDAEIRRVTAADADRPQVEREQQAAAWVPIAKKKPKR